MAILTQAEFGDLVRCLADDLGVQRLRDKLVAMRGLVTRRGAANADALASQLWQLTGGLRRQVPASLALQGLWAEQVGAKGLVLGGGVAANSLLRERFLTECTEAGIRGFLPSRAMCTDNAAMIAATGWHRLRSDGPTGLDAGAYPNLRLPLLP